MNVLRELLAIFSLEWRRLRSSPRVVVLVILYLASSALFLFALVHLASVLEGNIQGQINDPSIVDAANLRAKLGVLGWLFPDATPDALEALAKIPLIVFVTFRASLFFAPIWIVLLGYDVVSEEISTRSLRYVSVRARRSLIVVGKFLALGSVLVGMLLLVTLGILFYAQRTTPEFTGSLFALTFLRWWAASSLFALGYLGLTILCSTLATPPSLALALNLLSLFVLWLLNLIGGWNTRAALDAAAAGGEKVATTPIEFLQWITPSYYGNLLLNPDPHRFLIGSVGFLVFIALFVGGAAASLQRRDV